jgi:O-antigen/teichoic acid export membrane protein
VIKAASLLIKNTSYNLMADASGRVGNYLLVIMISRMLDAAASGTYTIAFTYLNIGMLISYWGFSNIRVVAKDPASFGLYFSNSLFLRTGFSLITTVVIIGIVSFLNYDPDVSKILILLSLSILAGSLNQIISAAFMAFEKIKYLSIVSMIFSLIKIGLGYLFLSNQGGLLSIALLLISCDYLALLINLCLVRKHLPRFRLQIDPAFCLSLVKVAFPLFGIALVTLLDTRTEIIIVSLFLGETTVGFYTAVNTILGLFLLFPESIRYAALPFLARFSISQDGKFNKVMMTLSEFIFLATVPVTVLVFFFSADLIQLVFTSKFVPSIAILQIVVWSFVSYSLTVIATRALIVLNREGFVARATLISAIITNLLNLIVAPLTGLTGIAYVRLGTSIFLFLMCAYFLAKMGYRMIGFSFLWRMIVISVLMTGGMALAIGHEKWLALIVGVVIYMGGLFLLKILTRKEIGQVGMIFRLLFSQSRKSQTYLDD